MDDAAYARYVLTQAGEGGLANPAQVAYDLAYRLLAVLGEKDADSGGGVMPDRQLLRVLPIPDLPDHR